MSEKTLNYRSRRDDARGWRPSTRQVGLGLLLLIGAIPVGWILFVGPTGAQFRLDTGDWRYTYFGIPGDMHPMPEPERTTVVSIAAGSAVLKPQWAALGQGFAPDAPFKMYYRGARWATVNPQIARALLEDAAQYASGVQPPQGATFCDVLVRVAPVGPGVWKPLVPGAEQQAVDYLKAKGLPVPTTAGSTTAPASQPVAVIG